MSGSSAVNVECYGSLQRIPLENVFITIDKLKQIISNRFHIDYPFNLTYEGAELFGTDTVHDLGIDQMRPIRVRRSSIESPPNKIDIVSDVFLSYEQTHRQIVTQLKEELQERSYFCWLDTTDALNRTSSLSSETQGAIQTSTVFVGCITNRYVQSGRCLQELSYAKQNNKPIILLLLERMNWPPRQITNLVSGLPCIQFYHTTLIASSTPWSSEEFHEFISKLSELAPHF